LLRIKASFLAREQRLAWPRDDGAVIGSEGYGFAQDQWGKSHPIPQTGNGVPGDRVRIGANCCIDRPAYRTTRIGAGTKLDNLWHIAHNVRIGAAGLLTSMFCVAGSTIIGNRVMTSGQTGVLDHVRIRDDVVLGPPGRGDRGP
jgi:UDP-3-O-[3-hydroxymyristoyl] glucosamine N-acyltransferase